MKNSEFLPKVIVYNMKGAIVKTFEKVKRYDLLDLKEGLYLAIVLERGKIVLRKLIQIKN